MIPWPRLSAFPLVPSPVPFACPLWPPVPALLPAPRFRSLSCPLDGSLRTRSASPTILPALLSVPTAASAARAPPAPPTCPSRAAAASLVMVTTCPGAPANGRAGPTPVSPLPLPRPSCRAPDAAAPPLLLTVLLRRRRFRYLPPVTPRLPSSRRMRGAAAPLPMFLALAVRAELAHAPLLAAPLPLRRA
ncbi:unnamed protein product [Closterium sp. Naga37s-1]|nr:unnamed protein product [Closterium sp. Naga37s-1]